LNLLDDQKRKSLQRPRIFKIPCYFPLLSGNLDAETGGDFLNPPPDRGLADVDAELE
jgi:hypothetical protein